MKFQVLVLSLIVSSGALMAVCEAPKVSVDFFKKPADVVRAMSKFRGEITQALNNMIDWTEWTESDSPEIKADMAKLGSALKYVADRLGSTKVPVKLKDQPAGEDSVYDILTRLQSH